MKSSLLLEIFIGLY